MADVYFVSSSLHVGQGERFADSLFAFRLTAVTDGSQHYTANYFFFTPVNGCWFCLIRRSVLELCNFILWKPFIIHNNLLCNLLSIYHYIFHAVINYKNPGRKLTSIRDQLLSFYFQMIPSNRICNFTTHFETRDKKWINQNGANLLVI